MKISMYSAFVTSWILLLFASEIFQSPSDAMTINSSRSNQEPAGDDARTVARNFLESWKSKDALGVFFAAGRASEDKLPESFSPGSQRYKSCFGSTSWRWQVVNSWPGEFDEVRIRNDGQDHQEAYVKFDELDQGNTVVVVSLQQSEGHWIPEDLLRLPHEDFDVFGKLVHKADPPAKTSSCTFDEMDFHKTTFDSELLEQLFATVREDKWDIYVERMQWVVFDLPGWGHQVIEPTPSVIAALGDALAIEDNRPLQSNAEHALSKMGVAAFPTIRSALREGTKNQKLSAMRVLRELSKIALHSNWSPEFGDPSHRHAARFSIRGVLGNYAMVDLVPFLVDEDIEIRRAAVISLGEISSKISMQPFSKNANFYVGKELLKLLDDDKISPEVCRAIGQLIPQKTKLVGVVRAEERHFAMLKELLERFPVLSIDARAEVICALEPGLGNEDLDEQVTNLLVDSLQHENPTLRLEAARMLSDSTSFRPRVIRELERALSVENLHKGVFAAALFQLSRETVNAQQALDSLTQLLNDKSCRNSAANALGQIGENLSIEARRGIAQKLMNAYQADSSFVVARKIVESSAPELLASQQNTRGLPLCISPNNQLVALYGGTNDKSVRVVNLDDGKICFETQAKIGIPRRHFLSASAAFSPSGKLLAASTEDNSVCIWDVRDKRKVAELHGHTDIVYLLAFSTDEKFLISTAGDETIRLWDLESSTELRQLEPNLNGELKLTEKEVDNGRRQLLDLNFNRDGTITTVSSYGSIFVWESGTGRIIKKYRTTMLANACVSPDGTCVAVQSKNSQNVSIVDVASGYVSDVMSLESDSSYTFLHDINSFAFLGDNETLFAARKSGLGEQILVVGTVKGLEHRYQLTNFKPSVLLGGTTVVSSPDGSIFLRGTSEEDLLLWEIRSSDN